ncbi:MAG: TVP38/TMEM64 family protein [Intestinibacillus sp.]
MKQKTIRLFLTRVLPLAIMLVCVLFWRLHAQNLTADSLQNLIPKNRFLAALALMLFYVLKSLSVFFPVVVLQLCAGLIFPWPLAIAVSIAGAAVEATIPYWIGRASGAATMEALLRKYPKAKSATKLYQGREFFFSFLLRAVACLPLDMVSMLLGSMKLAYPKFLSGSVLGMLPGILAATILGGSITRPGTPAFWISLFTMIAVGFISLLAYHYMLKRHS